MSTSTVIVAINARLLKLMKGQLLKNRNNKFD